MRLKVDFKIAGVVAVLAGMAIFFVYAGEYVNMPAETADIFIMMLPELVVIGISALVIPRRGLYMVAGFAGLGIGFALLIGTMYAQGIVSDQMLTGLTIGEEQILIVGVLTTIGLISLAFDR